MKFDIEEAIKKIKKPWTPVDLATFEKRILRVALFEGEYQEHSHEYDEFFLVYKGQISIWTEHGTIELTEGKGGTVKKGVKHKPFASKPSYVLMVDPV